MSFNEKNFAIINSIKYNKIVDELSQKDSLPAINFY